MKELITENYYLDNKPHVTLYRVRSTSRDNNGEYVRIMGRKYKITRDKNNLPNIDIHTYSVKTVDITDLVRK